MSTFPTGKQELMDAASVFTRNDRWWLVHTKARHEKALARDLDAHGIGYFLPCVRVEKRRLGRTATVRLPLFPGYLFLRGGEEDRHATLATNHAASVRRVVDQKELQESLIQIHRVLEAGQPVDVFPAIRRGRKCRIRAGALKGLEGVVLRRRGVCLVYLAVRILGQSAEVEIDPALVEVLGE